MLSHAMNTVSRTVLGRLVKLGCGSFPDRKKKLFITFNFVSFKWSYWFCFFVLGPITSRQNLPIQTKTRGINTII